MEIEHGDIGNEPDGDREHIAERQPLPDEYLGLSDEEMDRRIASARQKLGQRLVILGHHYQRDEVIKFADYTGDSYMLARHAASHPDAEFIVFCGVHFMAETAKILNPGKTVLIPDEAAGCSLADSITAADVRGLRRRYPGVPVVTYVNTSAAVKAESDLCCTSGNAKAVVESLDLHLLDEHPGIIAVAAEVSKL